MFEFHRSRWGSRRHADYGRVHSCGLISSSTVPVGTQFELVPKTSGFELPHRLVYEQFQLAMDSRYSQMRRLQRYSLSFLYGSLSFYSTAGALWGALTTPANIKKYLTGSDEDRFRSTIGSYYFFIDASPDDDHLNLGMLT